MYIQEVILDGFKSYAQRTVVSGFDPQFNAITGLNGSGKSNILDAICFVLGISNLSQVRVGNLQELVYKQGQAGVTKATVTIVFNNNDSSTSPVGYESDKQITVTRQVVIGGKNKYMINGRTVQQSQVSNLFHSVQLNVNNPHFLIMQGRITKVLNMKPEETLSMIEEAAGTRMFETKKQAALKTIEKKQLKVHELTTCLNEEITPTLDSLRSERTSYLVWQGNNVELARLDRFCAASKFVKAETRISEGKDEKQRMVDILTSLLTTQKEMTITAKKCAEKANQLNAQREDASNGVLKELRAVEADCSKELVKANSALENHKETYAAEQEASATLAKQSKDAEKSVEAKQQQLQSLDVQLTAKETEHADAQQASVSATEKYTNAVAGVADESNAALLSLPEQVGAWEKRAREAESQQKQGELKTKHAAASLKELKKTIKDQQSAQSTQLKQQEKLSAAVQTLEQKLGQVQAKHGGLSEESMRERLSLLKHETTKLGDDCGAINARLGARLAFEFRDPEKGFDRSRVKGMVARLIKVKDDSAATALEIAAGAKIQQVVVDTETTGKLLLKNGGLKKRVTILPLNKMNNRTCDPARLNKAKSIASKMNGSAHLALELVGFDKDVERAMQHVFGNTIICDTSSVAKAVAFDNGVKNRTVSWEGDVFDPSGTLTGGSATNLGTILKSLSQLNEMESELSVKQQEMKGLITQLKKMSADSTETDSLKNQLELKRHELQMCDELIAESSYAQSMGEIAALEEELSRSEGEKKELKAAHDRAVAELKKLKDTEKNVKNEREKVMKSIESEMKSCQKRASELLKALGQLKGKRNALESDMEACSRETQTFAEQQALAEKALARMKKDRFDLDMRVSECEQQKSTAHQNLQEKVDELAEALEEIKGLHKEESLAKENKEKASLEHKELEHKVKDWDVQCKQFVRDKASLLKEYPWIIEEKCHFGVEGGDFDFAAKDVPACLARLTELQGEQEKIAKKINKKVMGMIEKAESEYSNLTHKRDVILEDKQKIEDVIAELDVKKMQALQTTWIKVNRDFGSIFSMLLPGTHAKLEPPEGKGVEDGLEVRVAFNGVWKESLTELSGGQRSLLALSLILALLLFKPAPMYILDEVDAALDLSHTQNIGVMLRTHFQNSQFIVVSLKEGMFNNANTIFRTRFIDGVSAVIRTNGRKTGAGAASIEDSVKDGGAPSKKKGKTAKGKAASTDTENMNANLLEA